MSMQIPGIGKSGYTSSQNPEQRSSLSQYQRQVIEQTLADYDPENLSQADALSIVGVLGDAGITQGRDLTDAMSNFGFDAKTVGDMAGVGQNSSDGSTTQLSGVSVQALDISQEMLQQLDELITDYYDADLTDEEKASALYAIQAIFQQTRPEGGLIDVYA